MALVKGTNCGFVTEAPVDDPSIGSFTADIGAHAFKDTSPAGASRIIEIGWWCSNATEEANFEVGLYSHDAGNDLPDVRLHVDNTNAKGTNDGWKTVAVDWAISSETTYWLSFQLDPTATATNVDYGSLGGELYSIASPAATLANPWVSAGTGAFLLAIYAVYEVGGTPVNIVGTIAATSSMGGTITVLEVVELTGTIAASSSISGALTVTAITALTGIIAGTSGMSGSITVSSIWQSDNIATTKRFVAIGNNSLYYESA